MLVKKHFNKVCSICIRNILTGSLKLGPIFGWPTCALTITHCLLCQIFTQGFNALKWSKQLKLHK